MLPSHLMDATKKKNEPRSRTRLGSLPPPPPPSLCVTGALSQIGRWTVVNHSTSDGGDGGDNTNTSTSTSTNTNTITSTNTNTNRHQRHQQQQQQIVLSYCIFRPRQLHDMRKPPLVVIHGGPSIPSNYLLPIVNGVTDRTVILYDQWGCGKSSRPAMTRTTKMAMATISETASIGKNSDSSPPRRRQQHQRQSLLPPPFSILTMVEHFRQLVEECWKLKSYHLLGHSWGGILAYEYLKMKEEQQQNVVENDIGNSSRQCCRSLVLASAPTSARLIQKECKILMSRLQNEEDAATIDNSNTDDKDDETDDDIDTLQSEQIFSEEFHQTHECRLPTIPLALLDAIAQAGPWRGIAAIPQYVATPPPSVGSASSRNDGIDSETQKKQDRKQLEKIEVPTMLLRGEYDFCTEKCMAGWMDLITVEPIDSPASTSSEVHGNITALKNCSHYAMLEDERQFGKVVSDFLQLHDQQVEDKK